MIETYEVIAARCSEQEREAFIARHSEYILRCASKSSGRWVDRHDDIYSISLIAFNDAITTYDSDKGSFETYCATLINRKVIDSLRKENRASNVIPFSTLSSKDEHGNEIPFDIEDGRTSSFDAALEISSLERELEHFGISFFDLPKSSPKSAKTKKACREVVSYITNKYELLEYIMKMKRLPLKQIRTDVGVNEKVLERYRKYIIAGILICSGGYTIMSEYFNG